MNNDLKIFNNPEFGDLRTVTINNEIWFVGKDVAEALGYKNNRQALLSNVDEYDRGVHSVDTPSGTQEMTIINESGLYSLVLSSKLPTAKKFKRWITSEVLPSIRKHGVYAVDEVLSNPDMLIAALTELKSEREKTKALMETVDVMKPKALFADAVAASDTSILIGDLAKLLRQNGYPIGQNRLFEQLRREGFLMKNGSSKNMPTQKAMEMGLFEVKETTITNPDGSIRVTRTTKVTGKGQIFFINKYCRKGGKPNEQKARIYALS